MERIDLRAEARDVASDASPLEVLVAIAGEDKNSSGGSSEADIDERKCKMNQLFVMNVCTILHII